MRIETYQDYLFSLRTLADCDRDLIHERVQLSKPEQGLTADQVTRCMMPLEYFRAGVAFDIMEYEQRVNQEEIVKLEQGKDEEGISQVDSPLQCKEENN